MLVVEENRSTDKVLAHFKVTNCDLKETEVSIVNIVLCIYITVCRWVCFPKKKGKKHEK